eukprot:CAMPEP_0113500548 /NCGR_PEP_ID=MMETSP0014_2-20120614/32394_1 /TAXON_ID=2857 /ORGANISM="Nitzschia sp." /LENGTH=995 /DNA_ID=CAMNT_0000394905 /DNA_START=67 /DNA_END=3054 /DNA_ORIENTATION=+ /assembly_acc=CAM_ASM_000159
MSSGYNHNDGIRTEEEDDEDIGALGSILSWDEDEDGDNVGVGSSMSDRDSMHASALPDLVSFNLSKDGGSSSNGGVMGSASLYLQQLVNGMGNVDPSTLNISLPNGGGGGQATRHYENGGGRNGSTEGSVTSTSGTTGISAGTATPRPPPARAQPQHAPQQETVVNAPPPPSSSQPLTSSNPNSNNTAPGGPPGHTQQLEQQQQQIQQQQQQIQQQQQQIQQQQFHQQQLQQQQQQIQQMVAGGNPNGQQQQQQQPQVQQPQVQPPQQVQQQAAAAAAAAQAQFAQNAQNAFSILQQNALLVAQQQQARNGGQQVASVQPQNQGNPAVGAPFNLDPTAILRQLQVAQLQQQFNAVQAQAQAQAQNAQMSTGKNMNTTAADASGVISAAGSQPPPPQQQQQQQRPNSAQALPSRPISASAVIPPMNTGPAAKRARLTPSGSSDTATAGTGTNALLKPPPASSTQAASRTKARPSTTKAPVVSASDTDCELSMKISGSSVTSTSSRTTKKSSGSTLETNADMEIDTSNMTPAERAKANRDRNREHARNTRLRKKAYLEKLKTTVDELCRERDTLVTERAGAANILVEMNNTRTEVLMSFFALRSANEKRRELWASILDESSFVCVAPVTPYRSFPASEVQVSKCQRTILGIDGMMADTASLHVLLNTLVDRSRFPNASIVFRYTLVTEEAVVAGNQMMARWVMTTLNATQCGARMEVAKQGMLCCKFNSAHKIIGIELMFDVMALMLQLKQAAGSDTFSVIPNTVQTCQRTFDKPMVMILAEEPYTIVQVNKLWEDMTGYKAEDVVGKTSCRLLEGEQTNDVDVETLMDEIRFKRSASAMVVHYKKTGERFRNFFLAYPLSTDSRITHYLLYSNYVGPMDGTESNESGTSAAVAITQPTTFAPQLANGPPTGAAAQANSLLQNFNAAQKQAGAVSGSEGTTLVASSVLSDQLVQVPPILAPNTNQVQPQASTFASANGSADTFPPIGPAENNQGLSA